MIAIPVLLGSIGRIFAGMAADRFGGRNVMSALLVFSAVPAIAIGFSTSFNQLLLFGLLLGVAGTTFRWALVYVALVRSGKTGHGSWGLRYGEHRPVGRGVRCSASCGTDRGLAYSVFVFAGVALIWGLSSSFQRKMRRRLQGRNLFLKASLRLKIPESHGSCLCSISSPSAALLPLLCICRRCYVNCSA